MPFYCTLLQPAITNIVSYQMSPGKQGKAVPTANQDIVILKSLNINICQLSDLCRPVKKLPGNNKMLLYSYSGHPFCRQNSDKLDIFRYSLPLSDRMVKKIMTTVMHFTNACVLYTVITGSQNILSWKGPKRVISWNGLGFKWP